MLDVSRCNSSHCQKYNELDSNLRYSNKNMHYLLRSSYTREMFQALRFEVYRELLPNRGRVKVHLPISDSLQRNTRQAIIFYRASFVLFYGLAITRKLTKTFYIHLHYNFCRGVACRVLVIAPLVLSFCFAIFQTQTYASQLNLFSMNFLNLVS